MLAKELKFIECFKARASHAAQVQSRVNLCGVRFPDASQGTLVRSERQRRGKSILLKLVAGATVLRLRDVSRDVLADQHVIIRAGRDPAPAAD